jgi:hypothetical protein
MAFVAITALMMVFGSGKEASRYSCSLCHNRKEVYSRTIVWLPIWQREEFMTNFSLSPDHHHDWYCYGTQSKGLSGGTVRACRVGIYADRSAAPDGCQ